MTKKLLFLAILTTSCFSLSAQNNPVENLTWAHWYQFPRNFFQLNWDEPAQPHNDLIGYNIYRNNELYRFQTETTIYNYETQLFGVVTNCDGESFLIPDSQSQPQQGGIEIYVTAVYNPEYVESAPSETIVDAGLLLPVKSFAQNKAVLFPNPTNGVLNIGSENVEKIVVYDISGKIVNAFSSAPKIDLGSLYKGLYIVKLFSKNEIIVTKVVIQ